MVEEFGDAVTLKGGLAIELRLERARTTKDVDLRLMGSPIEVLGRLQSAARRQLGDFLEFTVRPDDRHPAIQNDGLRYEGQRYRAECRLAGKIYGRPFGVDVAFGDPIATEPDSVFAADVLGFAGVAPPVLRAYPIETHVAEKLHAYTMPRARPNSRVKDLPDLALLAMVRVLESDRLRAAVDQTFAFRATHPVPTGLPTPPPHWEAPYATIAQEDALPWPTLGAVLRSASDFINPVLAGEANRYWAPERWAWEPRR